VVYESDQTIGALPDMIKYLGREIKQVCPIYSKLSVFTIILNSEMTNLFISRPSEREIK